MGPNRNRKEIVKSINYVPADIDDATVTPSSSTPQKTVVQPYHMTAGKVTHVQAVFNGKEVILVVKDSATRDINELVDVALRFFEYYDLGMTKVLSQASSNDRPNTVTKVAPVSVNATVKAKGKANKKTTMRRPPADQELEKVAMDANVPVYRERLVQVFRYIKSRLTDETIPEEKRSTFMIPNVVENVFIPIYGDEVSYVTIRNKVSACFRYMVKQGWIEGVGHGPRNSIVYAMVKNPYEDEMPAQAEFDPEYAKEAKMKELAMLREQ